MLLSAVSRNRKRGKLTFRQSVQFTIFQEFRLLFLGDKLSPWRQQYAYFFSLRILELAYVGNRQVPYSRENGREQRFQSLPIGIEPKKIQTLSKILCIPNFFSFSINLLPLSLSSYCPLNFILSFPKITFPFCELIDFFPISH